MNNIIYHQKPISRIINISLLVLLLIAIPCMSYGENTGYKVFKVKMETSTENKNSEPVKDFYVNAGSEDGLSESMILDVYREKYITDNTTGNDFDISVHVGKVKVFRLYKNIAITRLHSLSNSKTSPVIEYRTVMIGDYVVPKIKKTDNATGSSSLSSLIKKDPLSDGLLLPSNVLFKLSDWKLKPEALEMLSTVNGILNQNKDKDILIEGYTCSLGTYDYNLELSRKRAQTVADYFKISTNIPADRIHIKSHGERSPIASNITEDGRRKNRRVIIRFIPHDSKKS